MKYLLLPLLVVLFIGCKESEDEKRSRQYNEENAAKAKEFMRQQDSIKLECKTRGHVFDLVRNYRYTGGIVVWGSDGHIYESDTTLFRLVDVPDSSYIVRQPNSTWQHCNRCNKDIEIPSKAVYVKTIWRRIYEGASGSGHYTN